MNVLANLTACKHNSSVGVFNPMALPITDFVIRVVGNQDAITWFLADRALLLVHLDSLPESAIPANHVMITLFGYTIVFYVKGTDKAGLFSGIYLADIIV